MDSRIRDRTMAEVDRSGAAYVRNLALAEAAVLRGQFNAAKVLRALAHTQRVQALDAARLLVDDVNPHEALRINLAELEQGRDDGLAARADADASSQHWAERRAAVRERAQDIARRAMTSLEGRDDVKEADVALFVWGCHGCGYLVEGDLPHACPVCGALAAEFAWFGPFYSSTPEHLGQLGPAEILAILEAVPDEIEAAIGAVDEERLRARPSPDEWCAAEIVGHMVETELLFARRVRTVLAAEGEPSLDSPVPPWKLHEGQGYEELPVPELLERVRETRAATVELVRGLTPEDWSRSGTIRGVGTTLLDLGTWLANHDRGHLAQIRRLAGG